MKALKTGKIVMVSFFILSAIRLIVAVTAIFTAEKGLVAVNHSGYAFLVAFILSAAFLSNKNAWHSSEKPSPRKYSIKYWHLVVGVNGLASVYSIIQGFSL